jgi:Glycosyl hydrolase family 46/Ricin-type beta-trefoil lectin domain-like
MLVTHTDKAPSRSRVRHILLWTTLTMVATGAATVVTVRGAAGGVQLNADQRLIIDRLESVLLHDTVVPQYDRVVNQFDGRGYVAGIGDFSTAGGQVLDLVETYTARVGPNALSRDYLPALQRLAGEASAEVDDLVGFPDAWRRASADDTFRQVQDDVLQSRYFTPARAVAEGLGLTTPLGLAIIYDSLIQHGSTSHPDALPALIERANASAGGTPGQVAEREWLAAFLDVRESTLVNPTEPADREIWPNSVGRVEALADLLADDRDALAPPIEVNPYGTRHVLLPRPLDEKPFTQPTASPTPTGAQPAASRTSANGSAATPTPGSAGATRTSGPPALTPPATPRVVTSPRANIVVRLVSLASGQSMGVRGGSTGIGAPIVQSGDISGSAQHWRLVPAHSGCYHVLNVRSGMALDNPDGTSVNGVQMQQYPFYWGNDNQSWCIRAVGSVDYSIRNLTSGFLLDVRDGGTSEGTAIQQWNADPANPNANQTWRLYLVG